MVYLRNPLVIVWLLLSAVTIASWWISSGAAYQLDELVTVSVLLISGVKSYLVISYFMEVRSAPRWLQQTMYGWLVLMMALLLLFYFCF